MEPREGWKRKSFLDCAECNVAKAKKIAAYSLTRRVAPK